MSGLSNIEWTDATWNPVTGCSKVSAGCKNCYAEALFPRAYGKRKFTDVQVHPERLDWPLKWRGSPAAKAEGRPSRIFVNSMSDLFHEDVPAEFIADVFNIMVSVPLTCRKRECEHEDPDCFAVEPPHMFQVLTKRPERMLRFLSGDLERMVGEHWAGDSPLSLQFECGPRFPNVWLGVSVEDQQTADERIPILLQTPAAVRWVSYEPALGPVDFSPYLRLATPDSRLQWLVAGGESGPRARPPHPDWFRSVRDQCQAAGVPFFFKQWGAWAPVPDGDIEKGDTMLITAGVQMSGCGRWARNKPAVCWMAGSGKEFPPLANPKL